MNSNQPSVSTHQRLLNQAVGRRQFVKTIFLGVASSGIGAPKWMGQIVAEAQASDIPFPAGQFTVRISDYPPLAKDLGSVSLEIPGLPNILLTRIKAGEFIAVTSVCTHEGCGVQPYSKTFGGLHCPCHRSLFAADGSVINGPATEPLYRYKLSYAGRNLITIELVKFSYLISAKVVPHRVHGHRKLSISFDTELLSNYAIMYKPSLNVATWTQVMFAENLEDEPSEEIFMGTGESVTLYIDMAQGSGIFSVARYHLLGG